MVNDHTRLAENWKCVWYLLRLYINIYIYRVYVDSHSLGQLALASKRTASLIKKVLNYLKKYYIICLKIYFIICFKNIFYNLVTFFIIIN